MKIDTPILKRLGPIPFWRGHDRCLDSLEAIYKQAAEKARGALAHETENRSSNQTIKPSKQSNN